MSLIALQKKIGVEADGIFGKGTLLAAKKYFSLSPFRAAHFFAQTSHETGDFKKFTENLNYSADGLSTTFSKYFPTIELAKDYQRNPEKIANRVYGSRMGNRDEASGDGWRYRGRGALQLTGHDNYKAFSEHLKNPNILNNPDIVAEDLSFGSALFFFERNKLWTICDQGVNDASITALSKRINGGTLGLEDRKIKTYKFYDWIISDK